MPTLFAAYEDRVLRIDGAERDWHVETVLDGGSFETVSAHRDEPDRVLVGTVDEGVHRSHDGGVSWDRVATETIDERVTALASDPKDTERFYLGTEPSAVYRSDDGGETWTTLDGLTDLPSASRWSFPPRPHTHHARWIEVDPSDPDHLYVAIEAGALVQTHDGGEAWEDRVDGTRRDVHGMASHPDAPGVAWCAAGDGFAQTSDGGDTWCHPQEGLDHRYCWSVAADPADPNRLAMSAASGPRSAHTPSAAESYVYYRTGDGAWQRSEAGIPLGPGLLRPVLASGIEAGSMYAATNLGCYRSGSAGRSWQRLDIPWPEALEEQTPRGLVVVA